MERTYIALVHKDPDSDYGVSFPDLPGCITVGSTLEEAAEMAREALALHLEGLAADDGSIPPPGSADRALTHEDAFDAIVLIVVEALPERTEEEAQAEFEAFLASDEYHEIYGNPLTQEAPDNLLCYEEPLESEVVKAGIGLKPIPATSAERTYAALVHKDLGSDFGVSFPDLPGCITAGSTLEEACGMAREALTLHLEGMSANGDYSPKPSSADAALAHEDACDAIALIVVTALPERVGKEAPVGFEASPASAEYHEIYGEPVNAYRQIDIPSGTLRSIERQTGVKLQ